MSATENLSTPYPDQNPGTFRRSAGRTRETARSEIRKAHDRAAIADLHINHSMTTRQIARQLGISQSTAVNDLGHLKNEWMAESKSIYADNMQESLRILDEAEKLYRQIFAHSVAHSMTPEYREIGELTGEGGAMKTKKIIRTTRVKPLAVKAVDGLVRIAKLRAEIFGAFQQQAPPVAAHSHPFSGLDAQERSAKLVQMLIIAAECAREKGLMPPLKEGGQRVEHSEIE